MIDFHVLTAAGAYLLCSRDGGRVIIPPATPPAPAAAPVPPAPAGERKAGALFGQERGRGPHVGHGQRLVDGAREFGIRSGFHAERMPPSWRAAVTLLNRAATLGPCSSK